MHNKPSMIVTFVAALTFSCGLPVFADDHAQPANAPSGTHMATDEGGATKMATPKHKKIQKKKRMAKKSKKSHKKSGDES